MFNVKVFVLIFENFIPSSVLQYFSSLLEASFLGWYAIDVDTYVYLRRFFIVVLVFIVVR